MERFLLKARNVAAYFCVCLVTVAFLYHLVLLFKSLSVSMGAVYEMAQTVLWRNFAAALVVVFACLFRKTDNKRMIDFIAFCGCSGMGSMFLLGLIVLVSGFWAGFFWIPLLCFTVAVYAGMGAFCLSVNLTSTLREVKAEAPLQR